jgi:hypothetical protein
MPYLPTLRITFTLAQARLIGVGSDGANLEFDRQMMFPVDNLAAKWGSNARNLA